MTSRWWRVGLAAVVLALVLGTVSTGPADARLWQSTDGPPETPDSESAIDDLVGCVQGSRRLLVLFLIDESASLKNTDPENRRVDAAVAAMDSLVALASDEGAPSVEVALAAFSNEYRLVRDWTSADEANADALTSSLGEFAELNNGIDTDFVNALTDGRAALAERTAAVTQAGGSSPCRAVLLFTDGGYDLAVREDAEAVERLGATKPYAPGIELTTPESVIEAEAAGRAALCDPGGVADRLRSDDITLLTVALSAGVPRRAQLPLASAAAGRADNYTCGTETERPEGIYLPAEDIDLLILRFNEVGTRLAGGDPVPGDDQVIICADDDATCSDGTREFQLDRSVRRVQVVALPPAPGVTVVIEAPGGERALVTEPGTTQVGAVEASARSVAGRGLAIDLERPAGDEGWTGTWTVSVTDPSGDQVGEPATLQVFLFSDLAAELGPSEPLRRGAPTELTALLVVPEGVDAAEVVESVEAELRLQDPVTGAIVTVPLDGPPTGPFTATYTTPADTTVNALIARAELRIRTTSGSELVAQSGSAELLVRRAEGAIQFAPPSLEMPSLTGVGTTEAVMQVLGGAADGCIWFGPVIVADPPDGVGEIVVTSDGLPLPGEGDCLAIPADGEVALTIEASPAARALGAVRGTLEVYERVDGAEASVTQVPFRFDLARGVDETRRLLLTVLLLAAGLGLPLLVLVLVNALTARFQVLDVVRGTALPVLVSRGTITRNDGPHPRSLSLRDDDFTSLAGMGSDKRFRFGGVEFRARASANPFGATAALAAPEGGAEKLKGKAGSRVELDPALAGSWVFLFDPNKTRTAKPGDIEGLLIAFVAAGDVAPQVERMLPDIHRRLPDTASRLAGLVREAHRKPSKRKAPVEDADGAEGEGADDEGGHG